MDTARLVLLVDPSVAWPDNLRRGDDVGYNTTVLQAGIDAVKTDAHRVEELRQQKAHDLEMQRDEARAKATELQQKLDDALCRVAESYQQGRTDERQAARTLDAGKTGEGYVEELLRQCPGWQVTSTRKEAGSGDLIVMIPELEVGFVIEVKNAAQHNDAWVDKFRRDVHKLKKEGRVDGGIYISLQDTMTVRDYTRTPFAIDLEGTPVAFLHGVMKSPRMVVSAILALGRYISRVRAQPADKEDFEAKLKTVIRQAQEVLDGPLAHQIETIRKAATASLNAVNKLDTDIVDQLRTVLGLPQQGVVYEIVRSNKRKRIK